MKEQKCPSQSRRIDTRAFNPLSTKVTVPRMRNMSVYSKAPQIWTYVPSGSQRIQWIPVEIDKLGRMGSLNPCHFITTLIAPTASSRWLVVCSELCMRNRYNLAIDSCWMVRHSPSACSAWKTSLCAHTTLRTSRALSSLRDVSEPKSCCVATCTQSGVNIECRMDDSPVSSQFDTLHPKVPLFQGSSYSWQHFSQRGWEASNQRVNNCQ